MNGQQAQQPFLRLIGLCHPAFKAPGGGARTAARGAGHACQARHGNGSHHPAALCAPHAAGRRGQGLVPRTLDPSMRGSCLYPVSTAGPSDCRNRGSPEPRQRRLISERADLQPRPLPPPVPHPLSIAERPRETLLWAPVHVTQGRVVEPGGRGRRWRRAYLGVSTALGVHGEPHLVDGRRTAMAATIGVSRRRLRSFAVVGDCAKRNRRNKLPPRL